MPRALSTTAAACVAAAVASLAAPLHGSNLHPWPEHFARALGGADGDRATRRMLARHGAAMRRWPAASTAAAPGSPVLTPVAFGADPSGATDSTPAFKALGEALLTYASNSSTLDNGIADLQGATVDLQGGAYLLSAPFRIPPGVGNMRVINGDLLAAPSFPRDGYLLHVGELAPGCSNAQGSCNVDIGMEGLSLDGRQVAAGGAFIANVMGEGWAPDTPASKERP